MEYFFRLTFDKLASSEILIFTKAPVDETSHVNYSAEFCSDHINALSIKFNKTKLTRRDGTEATATKCTLLQTLSLACQVIRNDFNL